MSIKNMKGGDIPTGAWPSVKSADLPDLFHFSRRPLRKYIPAPEQPGSLGLVYKPHGLWVTDDSEYNWEWWSTAEGFMVETLAHKQQIALHDDANILFLNSVQDILQFTDQYKEPTKFQFLDDENWAINWERVTSEFDGILISPYQWDLRLDKRTRWYYPWDCASGCIWGDVVEGWRKV